jgi:membrane protein YdbS with pleckstrin-like domain
MGRVAALLILIGCILAAILLLEWIGVFAALMALVGLLALVMLLLVAVAVAVVAFLSIPYFFVAKKMEVREGSFTLDRLEEKK